MQTLNTRQTTQVLLIREILKMPYRLFICSRKMFSYVTLQCHPFDLFHRSVNSCCRSVFDSMYDLYENLTNVA